MKAFTLTTAFLSFITLVSCHGRLRQPKPLGYGTKPQLDGNAYNAPLKADGSDFPCKGLIGVADMTPVAKWSAGSKGMFEIWPNEGNGGEGNLAAHSGGSCQISLSYDNGKSFKVLHSYEGGCPRDTPLNSNIAGPNQTFVFDIPSNAKAGNVIAAWSWIAQTGNRGEYYMNCASVTITGSGTSTLDDLPDMYLGDMVTGQIKPGMCVSTQGFNLLYPFPGNKVTKGGVGNYKGPTGGPFEQCRSPGSTGPGGPGVPTPTDTPNNTPPKDTPKVTPTMIPTPTGQAPYPEFEAIVGQYTYSCKLK